VLSLKYYDVAVKNLFSTYTYIPNVTDYKRKVVNDENYFAHVLNLGWDGRKIKKVNYYWYHGIHLVTLSC